MRVGFPARPSFRSELNAKERERNGRELIVIGFGDERLFFRGHLGIRHVLSQDEPFNDDASNGDAETEDGKEVIDHWFTFLAWLMALVRRTTRTPTHKTRMLGTQRPTNTP